jgi:hypothetical protein
MFELKQSLRILFVSFFVINTVALAIFLTAYITPFFDGYTILLQSLPIIIAFLFLLIPGHDQKTIFARLESLKLSHFFFLLIGLSVVLLIVLIAINKYILHSFFNSNDEYSCYFLAHLFLKGKLWTQAPELQDFFVTAHVGFKDGKWFSVFPPGWSLLWALGIKLHLQDVINPMIATLAYATYAVVLRRIFNLKTVVLSLVFMALSPFFLFTSAAYYSHNTCLLCLALFYYFFLKWEEGEKEILWASLAGIVLGYGMATRYLTMFMMATPFVISLLWRVLQRRKRFGLDVILFFLTAGTLTLVHFYYNYLITGSFFDAPNHYLMSHEKLGFNANYTPLTALDFFWKRLVYGMDWTPPLLILFFLASLFMKNQNRYQGLLKGSAVLLPFAYMFYYSWGGNQFGPRYYLEAFPIVCGLALNAIFRLLSPSKLTMGLIFGMIIGLIPLNIKHGIHYEKVSRERRATYDAIVEQTEKPALVFFTGHLGDTLILAPDDQARNLPDFDGDVIYARSQGEKNQDLMKTLPEYYAYDVSYDRKKLEAIIRKME